MTPQEIFDRNQKWAEGIARTCLRHLPPSFDGDDLKQAALIALWQCAKRFDDSYGVPFQGYAHPYVQKACWMLIRRREYVDSTMEELPDTVEAPAAKRPDSQVIRHESHEEVHRQLQALPAAHRKVVEGLYLESHSLMRLAERLRTSAGNVARLRDESLEFIRSESARKLRRAELRRGVARIK